MPRAAWWWMALLAGTAKADPVDPFTEPDESELLEAEERVVTVASRYAQGSARASSIVTVITASEIRERGYRTLADALSSIPGVYITVSSEGRRLAWTRGVISDDNNKVLLLVDGVPWADGLYNHAWIDEYLSLSMVRQVEVIRGPASTTYGANAFAAVINVVTYSPGDLRGGFARGDVGSFGRKGASLVFGDRLGSDGDEVGVRVYARAMETDGDGLSLLPDGSQDVTGDQPKRAMSAGLLLEHRGLSVRYDHVDYRHSSLTSAEDTALSALFQSADLFSYRYVDDFAAARWDLDLGQEVVLTPEVYWQRYDDPGQYGWLSDSDGDDADSALESGLVDAEKLTTRYGAAVQAELRPALNHVTLLGVGLDATRLMSVVDRSFYDSSATALTDTFYAPQIVLVDAFGFVQHHWTPLWWVETNAGLRLDRRDAWCLQDIDTCTLPEPLPVLSPRAGVAVVPGNGLGFKATYGRAFRAPNARELFVQVGQEDGANLATASNPALRPEVIDSVEAEVSVTQIGPMNLRVDAFASRIRDEIDKVRGEDSDLGDVWYDNREGSNVLGGEAEAGFARGPWEASGSLSLTHTVDLETGLEGYGFPPVMGHARVGWAPVEGLKLSALGDYVGRRPQAAWSPDAGLPDGDPYTLVHLAVSTEGLVQGRVRADLSVRNVLNTAYTRPLYRDEVNALDEDGDAANPYALEGEERNIILAVEVAL